MILRLQIPGKRFCSKGIIICEQQNNTTQIERKIPGCNFDNLGEPEKSPSASWRIGISPDLFHISLAPVGEWPGWWLKNLKVLVFIVNS